MNAVTADLPVVSPLTSVDWQRVPLPSGGAALIRSSTSRSFRYVSDPVRVARDAAGRPRVALSLMMQRVPTATEPSLEPLVTGGILSLSCTYALSPSQVASLEKQLKAAGSPFFVRSGALQLLLGPEVIAQTPILGAGSDIGLHCTLPAAAAFQVLRAFEGSRTGLALRATIVGPNAPPACEMALEQPFGGLLDGLDRSQFIKMIVVQASGEVIVIPPPRLGARSADRNQVPLIATGSRAVSLPAAMTAAPRVSASALMAGGASAQSVSIGPNVHLFLIHDTVIPAMNPSVPDAPREHLPMLGAAGTGPTWPDAIDSAQTWYAPAFSLALPKANDPPDQAPFSFEVETKGITIGPDGTSRRGLSATLRLTIRADPLPNLPARSTAVKLDKVSCSLEVPYRQSGSATLLTQRFPGVVSLQGNLVQVTVALLDDWVRIAYATLAYAADASTTARLIIDYVFTAYFWWQGPAPDGDGQMVGGGLHHPLPVVATAAALPRPVLAPTLVRDQGAVVGPGSYVQYRREAAGVSRSLQGVHLDNAAITIAHPALVPAPMPPRRLGTRSVGVETAVSASVPCTAYGAFYLQRGQNGTETALGCQDSLRLGETSMAAFAEEADLGQPSFRVFRSLQQPARFMVVPAAYRVGRYGVTMLERAYRPMISIYGVLSTDAAKTRYALTATLIPDVSPTQLAKLHARLAQITAAGSAPQVVYPTDPFVGAKTTFAWSLPAEISTPEALTVVDSVVVTLSTKMEDGLLLLSMIDHSGIQGAVSFSLTDGLALNAALSIDGHIIGPPESGPVVVDLAASGATLTNRTQTTMHVTDVVAVDAAGATTVTPVDLTLAPGSSSNLGKLPGAVSAYAEATAASKQDIEELDVFVEDVTTEIVFVNQVNFANHGLTGLRVQGRLKGTDLVETATLPEGQTASIKFTLPITNYLSVKTLQYALVKTSANGASTGAWRDWDLSAGTVIGVTADQL